MATRIRLTLQAQERFASFDSDTQQWVGEAILDLGEDPSLGKASHFPYPPGSLIYEITRRVGDLHLQTVVLFYQSDDGLLIEHFGYRITRGPEPFGRAEM